MSEAAGTSAVDISLGTGIFKTTTGAVTLSSTTGSIALAGPTTLNANQNFTVAAGTSAVDLSAGTGVFKSTNASVTLAGSNVTTGVGVTLTTANTTGKALAISTGNGLTTGQAVTIDTGTSVFTSTAGGALGITSNSTTSGVVVGISATGLTNATPGKALALTLGTAGTGIFVNTSAAYTGNLLDLNMNGTDIFRVNQLGALFGSTANVATIKAIEIGTCTNPGGAVTNWVCSAALGAVTGITIGSLTATDSITLTGQGVANNVGCFVAAITAGTSFTIRCNANPGNGTVYNVMVVRH